MSFPCGVERSKVKPVWAISETSQLANCPKVSIRSCVERPHRVSSVTSTASILRSGAHERGTPVGVRHELSELLEGFFVYGLVAHRYVYVLHAGFSHDLFFVEATVLFGGAQVDNGLVSGFRETPEVLFVGLSGRRHTFQGAARVLQAGCYLVYVSHFSTSFRFHLSFTVGG